MKKMLVAAGLIISLVIGQSPELCSQSYDFGDAPSPYPSKLALNGARHLFAPGVFLGSYWDAEPDAALSLLSFGDDLNFTLDDEDGVRFTSFLLPGQNCTIEVTASVPGYLNGWIDFQVNSQWTDPNDWIFQDLPVNPGSNFISFTVPSNIPPGIITFARFRFSTVPGLGLTGPAPDGEVEDYNVLLGAPPGQEIFLDPDPTFSFTQNEISLIMVSGTNSPQDGMLIAAYNDSPFPGGPGMGISISNDYGATWTASHLAYPINTISGLPMAESFDPSIAYDGSGNVYVAQIATDGNWFSYGPSSGLYVFKSVDGGLTWGSAVPVDIKPGASATDSNYRLNDRCQVRIDRYASSPNLNNIYLAWIQDRGNDITKPYSDIYFSRSTDGGVTFTSATRVNSWIHNKGNMPVHDVAPDGTVYLLWVDYNVKTGGLGTLFLNRSTDGGTTWGTDDTVITVSLPNINLNYGTDARAKGAAVLRVNPLNSQELFVVYAADADTTAPGEADIFFISSQDAGSTWTTPAQVNDDISPADTSDQVMPWMEVQNDGTIHIAWYDRRNDQFDNFWDVYYTNSVDGGQTFDANHRITLVSFPTPQAWLYSQWNFWMGEYLGLAVADHTAFIAYTSSVPDPFGDVHLGSYLFSSAGNKETTGSGRVPSFFTIYPNPSDGELNVGVQTANEPGSVHAGVFSAYGQSLLQADIRHRKEFSLPVDNFSQGVYWIRITTGEMSGVQKFIIVK